MSDQPENEPAQNRPRYAPPPQMPQQVPLHQAPPPQMPQQVPPHQAPPQYSQQRVPGQTQPPQPSMQQVPPQHQIPQQASQHPAPQYQVPPQHQAPAPIIVSHPYYAPPQAQPTNGAATAGLVLGIASIVLGIWTPIPFIGLIAAFVSFIPALLSVIFGHVGLRNARKIGVGRGAAKTGMVLGYVVLGLIVVTTLVWVFFAYSSGFDLTDF